MPFDAWIVNFKFNFLYGYRQKAGFQTLAYVTGKHKGIYIYKKFSYYSVNKELQSLYTTPYFKPL